MQARINNPAMAVPGVMEALSALSAATEGRVASRTLDLIYLRVSQINGCSVCVELHTRDLRNAGETDERIFAVSRLARVTLLHGRGTVGAGARRGRDPDLRSAGPGLRRDLGRGRALLRRAGPGGARRRHRHDQHLESPERDDQAGCRRLDGLRDQWRSTARPGRLISVLVSIEGGHRVRPQPSQGEPRAVPGLRRKLLAKPCLLRHGARSPAGRSPCAHRRRAEPLLDVGAGQGRNALYLARLGYRVDALEPSADGAAQISAAAVRTGLTIGVINQRFEDFRPSGRYGTALVFGLIPDLTRGQVTALLKRAGQWLAPGGLAFLTGFTTEDPSFATWSSFRQVGRTSFEDPRGPDPHLPGTRRAPAAGPAVRGDRLE